MTAPVFARAAVSRAGRRAWSGGDRLSTQIPTVGGGQSAATAYTLTETAKLNRVDPQAWLTDVLSRTADHKITRLAERFPWRYAQT
ncbi:MAG TPA: transposase domain-containing protein [Thermohalobaculum sp.]|nr:transposase domain-containing protein [Thermohalobaculum sp.]